MTTPSEPIIDGERLLRPAGLLDPDYGQVNGHLVGKNLAAEKDALRQQYALQPGPLGRLRAATRKALGRG
jgi:hypothetical protein